MKVIKYCGICGNEIEIDYEPRQVVKTVILILLRI